METIPLLSTNQSQLAEKFSNPGLKYNRILADLKEQIEYFRHCEFESEIQQMKRDIFIKDLLDIYKEIQANIYRQERKSYYYLYIGTPYENVINKEIKASPAIGLAIDTTQMLINLKSEMINKNINIDSLSMYKKTYEEKCNKAPYLRNFEKSVVTVLMSGIGLILGACFGAMVGIGYGALFSAAGTPAVTIPVGIATGAAMVGAIGANIGFHLGRKINSIPKGAFKHFLTFKTPLYSAAKETAKSGMKLLDETNTTKPYNAISSLKLFIQKQVG
jgi:hypothetical protein